MYKVIILPFAKNDIKESALWYNQQSKGLGKKFTSEIKKQIQIAILNPYTFSIKYSNVRAIILKKFPYMIHFTIDESNYRILISAVLHTSRNSDIWVERIV